MGYLMTEPMVWDDATLSERSARSGRCGALVWFVGVARRDQHEGRTVEALWYEAHQEMAERQIDHLVAESKVRWRLESVDVRHRIGRVEAGQISVVVAVAAAHRDEAYATSQFLIEGIKHRVPIWKREHYVDGTSQWSTCHPDLAQAPEHAGASDAHV